MAEKIAETHAAGGIVVEEAGVLSSARATDVSTGKSATGGSGERALENLAEQSRDEKAAADKA